MDFFVRKATKEDFGSIKELNKKLFELEYNNFDSTLDTNWPNKEDGKNYYENSIKERITLVAELDNKVIGYLIGTLNTELSYILVRQAELDNMCVLDEYRKLGVGTKLFETFREICKENRIEEIKVTASYGNINAINFYKKNGFIEGEITLKQKI